MRPILHRTAAAGLGLLGLAGCGNQINNSEAEGATPIAAGSKVEVTFRADTASSVDQQQIGGTVKQTKPGWVVLDSGGSVVWVRVESVQKIRVTQAAPRAS